MDVKSWDVTEREHGFKRLNGEHVAFGSVASCLGILNHRGPMTVVVIKHPEPKEKRKEGAKLTNTQVYAADICACCGCFVQPSDERCFHCESFFTETITWAEFTWKDC